MKMRFSKIVFHLLAACLYLFFLGGTPSFAQDTANRYALVIGKANDAALLRRAGLGTSLVLHAQSTTSYLQKSIDDIDEQILKLQRRSWSL